MNKNKRISSWGNFPKSLGKEDISLSKKELSNSILKNDSVIPFGNRRSYGDCALNNYMIQYDNKKNSILLDKKTGIVQVKSNIQIKELIDFSLKHNWFLDVVPGTSYATVGGAIAADVHGKNHHLDGCFSECISSMNLMISNGEIVECSKTKNFELFRSTCGGMGLTGVILSAKLKMIKVKSHYIEQLTHKANNIEEIFTYFENNSSKKFTMAWLDCSTNLNNLGRGIFISGKYSATKKSAEETRIKVKVPFFFPRYFLNKYLIKTFNFLYYHINAAKSGEKRLISFYSFFFPLDKLLNWNKLYGKSGFIQYQFVLPKKNSLSGIKKILRMIIEANQISPLAVLKLFGPENKNYLSFPMEGYTLAIDFQNNQKLFSLLNRIDLLVSKLKGRIYLAKDARMKHELFRASYPDLHKFELFRKDNYLNKKFKSDQSKRIGIK